MPGRKQLTEKQKAYCKARAEGKTRPDAWIEAGYASNYSRENINSNAFQMETRRACSPAIQAEIARLQKLAEEKAILNREQRQAMLTEIALDTEEKTDNRLRAADMLNRMSGDYTDNIRSESVNKVQLSYAEKKAMLEAELRGDE